MRATLFISQHCFRSGEFIDSLLFLVNQNVFMAMMMIFANVDFALSHFLPANDLSVNMYEAIVESKVCENIPNDYFSHARLISKI